ncbi:MAG: hypothetical protein GX561_12080 [Lentisphaerae bacterium]|nr:hypothetical protein [Lentisphaerota bacterium]
MTPRQWFKYGHPGCSYSEDVAKQAAKWQISSRTWSDGVGLGRTGSDLVGRVGLGRTGSDMVGHGRPALIPTRQQLMDWGSKSAIQSISLCID